MEQQPWYHAGLRFHCSQCGDCCTGAPGFVWVNQAEITALAAAIDCADSAQFEQKYVRKVGIRKSLRELSDGACVFFDKAKRTCRVYHQRPRQCRSWPFWNSNIRTPAAWRQTCQDCPGSGVGELHTRAHIEAQCKVIRI